MAQDVEECGAGFALSMINFLARSVGPVADKRQVNFARRRVDTAFNHCDIVLSHLTLLKQAIEETLYRFAQSDDHQSRSIHIEPVHAFGTGKSFPDACQQ